MITTPRPRRDLRWSLVGLVCGGLAGLTVLAGGVVAAAVDAGPVTRPGTTERGLRDVLHTPPLLVARGQRVNLRYDAVCQSDGLGKPCELAGNVFVRGSRELTFHPVPLVAGKGSTLAATLIGVTAGDGFSYYTIIEDGTGSAITVPAGGAVAPQRAWAVPAMTVAVLGAHTFGRTRRPDERHVSTSWGAGANALGLISGRGNATIGPSAFDLDLDGSLTILDQVNDRLAVYPVGGTPRYLPIAFDGGEGDLAIGADGTRYVLDHASGSVVRTYMPAGSLVGTARIDDHGVDMLRAGPGGALVHAYPGDMWLPVSHARLPLEPAAQVAAARAGRSVGGGVEVVVHADPTEALFALVRGDRVIRAWRLTSATNIGEVQLVEPFGDGLLAVMRVWTEREAEFVVVVLTPAGVSRSFSVEAVEWAESAPLGRFRINRETLFQLRSAPSGADIVSFDIGGAK